MKRLLLILISVLHFQALFPQQPPNSPKGMVLISNMPERNYYEVVVDGNVIRTNDSLAKSVIEEFFFEIDKELIAYQVRLKDLQGVFVVEKPKGFIMDTKKGIILIGDYVDKFPRTKRILILNRLAVFFGARTFGGSSYNVLNRNFQLNEKTEEIYSLPGRLKRRVDMRYIIEELEKSSPINTKVR